ncbi:MAG: putative porin [Syntrophotaleaceae bacterium]
MLQPFALFLSGLLMIGCFLLAPMHSSAAVSGGGGNVDLSALIDLLREKGVLSADEAVMLQKRSVVEVPAAEIREERAPVRAVESADGSVRLTSSPAPATQAAPAQPAIKLPDWLNRIKIGGDIRLRYQGDYFDEGNFESFPDPNDLDSIINTTEDRQRFRYRARISLAAQVTDELKAAFRLATGNDDDPISTNDTLGDTFNKDSVLFDQAYLEWRPIPLLSVTGGRIPNPWFSTDLIWDKDLNFEGLALTYRQQYLDWLGAFATVGAFPIQEIERSEKDKWLYGGQVGINVGRHDLVRFNMAAAYYHFTHTEGRQQTDPLGGDTSLEEDASPRSLQLDNTPILNLGGDSIVGLAADFHELDILATLDIALWDPIHLVFLGEYVKNIGYDKEEVDERSGFEFFEGDQDMGYMFGAAIGHEKVDDLGRWNVYGYYRYIEADAVLSSFTDSDFHLGGTNSKGWVAGAEFGLMKNTWLSAKWQSSDEIEREQLGVDTLQVDLNAKF